MEKQKVKVGVEHFKIPVSNTRRTFVKLRQVLFQHFWGVDLGKRYDDGLLPRTGDNSLD